MPITEVADSGKLYQDDVFDKDNQHVADDWSRIGDVYPKSVGAPLLPDTLSREQFGQGKHYECFMLSTLATLVQHPDIIRKCFISKKVRQDGRYTFQFFRGKEWVKVEIDDKIAMEDGDVLYACSPTEDWWPLLLEKAYAKFYTAYDHLEGCTLQETYHDLTGMPVLNIPMDAKLAKTAGADVTEGAYWLDLSQRIQHGEFAASILTKDMDVENMGLQRDQQYGVLEIFSITGTSSVSDVVVHLHNPFEDEEFVYKGPMNPKDTTWTPKLKAKYDVDNERSIFLPLGTLLKITNSLQLCYMTTLEADATYYDDEWKGETAGGNPTSVTWRKNPLYYVRNSGNTAVEMAVIIKQEDQRRFTSPDEMTKYLQCGMILSQYTYPNPIPTFWVTGNNHKPIHKSLFLNSREVSNAMTIPLNSTCYLVPSGMNRGAEGEFSIALYRVKNVDYSNITIHKLDIPGINWKNPATKSVELHQKEKDRVDFVVDEATDIHILLHQMKPFISKTGGDAMTEDYMGMYLYDDTDRKIGGVHAATNFREVSIIHHLPRSGRFALSLTCPRAKGDVPAVVTIAGSHPSNVRIVDPPEDATMFDDEDEIIEEGDAGDYGQNPIDYFPIVFDTSKHSEAPDSNNLYEDKRFLIDNKNVTDGPWVHIGDLYPEGKNKPLLPDVLSRDQFEQGENFECCCLTGFAALVDHHPDVIRNCFISKKPRKDGRYTFQFHRYGQWLKVEIDDRIPVIEGRTAYCRSPTRSWWPLLLEKAYAKFYTLYQNLEGCTQQEVFHDFSGRPVVSIQTDAVLAKAANYDIEDPDFWLGLNRDIQQTALAGLTKMDVAGKYGLNEDQSYSILGFFPLNNTADQKLSDVVAKLYNPFVEADYTGPLNKNDPSWPRDMRQIMNPDDHSLIYMPVDTFCEVFLNVQQAWIKGPLEPAYNFNSEWGEGTNGGNPTLVTWRENPLYVIRNKKSAPAQIIAMIRQPDQRHRLHLSSTQELSYIQCGLILVECTSAERIPTYLVTGNNHRTVHKGLFLNSREVANIVTVPEDSLCYLVPSAMYRDMGKFILSYWYLNAPDKNDVDIVRLQTKVARQLPAIDHLELRHKEKERVDFLVDVPTDVHILLRQEKPYKTPNGGDAMAEDFLAMYLYDGNDKRVTGTQSASNYREIGLVHHVNAPGRYALSITCPNGTDSVPCKVEVVALEEAHVRITDPPENARELGEVDLGFLDPVPEGVPLADLPLDDDQVFQDDLERLKKLMQDEEGNADEIIAMKARLNDRAHDLAKGVLGKDRPVYLPGKDLKRLNPILNENVEYMDTERNRYNLKKDPRNDAKVRDIEGLLFKKADVIEERANQNDLGFLDPEYEGIPTQDIQVMEDPTFAQLSAKRAGYLQNPAANASKINDAEEQMHDRARELAQDMHEKERFYLDPEPEGVPLDLLPLNEDDAFSRMEDQLRALNRQKHPDANAIKKLQGELNERAHELARKLKDSERELFLDPQPLGVPISALPLDTDEKFHDLEVERLQLRHEDPIGNADRIRELEDQMNERARELARKDIDNIRAFLDQAPYGIPLSDLGLDYNDQYMKMEDQLRQLKKDPKANAAKIKDLEDQMRALVNKLAADAAARDRAFLDPEPEGRLVQTLPLDENPDFAALDKQRRFGKAKNADPEKLNDMEEEMNAIAHDIAHQMNKDERPDYLQPTFKGIPHGQIPLDTDQTFRDLEAKRQVQKRDPKKNAKAIQGTENDLNARAQQLAEDVVAGDRAYLDPEPEGVPLRLLPLNSDGPFSDMEAQRVQLKKDPQGNARKIAEVEDLLNNRAHELARNLKEKERSKFLDPKPLGVPIAELPLDTDEPFRDMEIQRLLLREDPRKNASDIQNLEEALNDRAVELAKEKKQAERAFLDPAPLGVPLEELPLDTNAEFLRKEDELRQLRKDPKKNAAAIAKLEDELNAMARQMAAKELAKNRGFLDPEPEGRLLEELPLDTDPQFHDLEMEYRDLKADPNSNPQKLADLEELMNDRAHQLAKAMNAADRPKYLNPKPLGVPVEELPLDTDPEFSQLEAQRAKLARNPTKNRKAIQDAEKALNARAEELAKEKIQGDREFLEKQPQGVPLKYLPLDDDNDFKKLESERLKSKAEKGAAHPKTREIEVAMNERANNVAKAMREQVRAQVLPQRYNGIPREALHLDDDMPFNDLEVAHIEATGDGEDEKKRDLADAMSKRAGDVADKLRAEERANLGEPLGYAPEDLPLDQNKDYMNKEGELIGLRTDAKKNAPKIAEAEKQLRALAMEIAKEKAEGERDYLDDDLEGRRQDELELLNDPQYADLEEDYHRVRRNPYADQDRLAELEKMMNDRAHTIARQKNAEERPNFLQEQRGVPLSELPLDTDEKFRSLEAERARLNHDPRKNADALRAVEGELNDRVAELTGEAIKNDRIFLDDVPEGVLQRQVDLDNDPEFQNLEKQRAALKAKDPRRNAAAIRDLEDQMNERLHKLADQEKWDARNDMDQNPLGIPLKDLAEKLDNDKHFHDLEEQYRDARKDPSRQKEANELLDQMNERAKELAEEMHDEERANLDQNPEGIPLNTLDLNADPKFLALENEARRLRNEPNGARRNADRLADLEDQMNERAKELANEARRAYVDANPEGVPLELLHLGDDPEFVSKEAELRRLEKCPVANKAKIEELKEELNGIAHAKAKALLENDRGYLDPCPEGVELRHVPIDGDQEFRDMEVERARLKAEDPRKNQRAIADLENKLNDRAHALAKGVKDNELRDIDQEQSGVPVSILNPHEDAKFSALAQKSRELQLDPKPNPKALQDVKSEMNARALSLAAEKLHGDRGYLNPKPEGVEVNYLPLDTDPAFHKLEVQRAKLKNSGGSGDKIRELEDQLNARAGELAVAQKQRDLEGLDQKPEGIPIDLIDPHGDAEFASYLPQLRELKQDPKGNKAAIEALQQKMNDRVKELAGEKLRGDRPKYVEDVVDGVPRDILPLDTDPKFHDLEVQRAILRLKDPRRNADKIKDLESKLNDRAHELAAEQKKKDLENLDQNPEGVPLSVLNPHEDPEFAKMVDQHRELMKDPKKNAAALKDLEEKMNERAHQLARDKMKNDRDYLEKDPQGVPLSELPLDKDEKFRAMEAERAKLKAQDPRRNAARIKKLEDQLNDRAHELARNQLDEDLKGVNPEPRGIPIDLLKPHEDGLFADLVKQARALKKDPKTNPRDLDNVVAAMNDRVDQLAKEAMDRDFLEPNPEGVPLSELPLDTDPQFHELEVERVKRKLKDPIRNRQKIKDAEDQLNARAHELAKEQIAKDLAPCEANPRGIPLDLLKPQEDKEIAALIPQLRALKKNPDQNAEKIKELEDRMKQRARELADMKLNGDRDYLNPKPNGVPLEFLPLDTDPTFADKEVQRAKLKAQNPRRNAKPIAELENDLNNRAYELADKKKEDELALFPRKYGDIDTVALKPHEDPEFDGLINQYRPLEKKGEEKTPAATALKEDMDKRLGELAKEKKDGDLWFLDRNPEGIPLADLPLDKDKEFQNMRDERARLKAADPRKNAEKIAQLEKAMNDRAHDLANEMKNSDFEGVDANPRGIPLNLLKPRDDAQVQKILPELRQAKKNKDTKKVNLLLDKLNNRVDELAKAAVTGDRPSYLDAEPEGVPLEHLPLDKDGIFSGLEAERAKLKLQDPVKNAKQIEDLEDRLNDRAHELAKQVKQDDLKNLNQNPRDLPLSSIKPHEDKNFNELAKQLRALNKDPVRNANKIRDLEDRMNGMVNDMADGMLAGDRGYLDPEPNGVPLAVLPLDTDPTFHDLEVKRAMLAAEDPVKNKKQCEDLEQQLNERAKELADEVKRRDLAGLDPTPLGVPVNLLKPHEDPTFAAMLPELRELQKDPKRNADRINALKDKLDARLRDLAADYLEKDRPTYLDPAPGGIPTKALPLDTDSEFKTLEAERLDLIDKNPRANKDAIADLERALNERAGELAKKYRQENRGFLDPEPEGVPLNVLPLDTDRQFADLEARRAVLEAKDPVKNAPAIRDLEEQMNDRAHQLAKDQIEEDLRNVDRNPGDIPLMLLNPYADPEFSRMVAALRDLKNDPKTDPENIAALEADMNDRAHEMAEEALIGDRDTYLDPNPDGVPLDQLPLDKDPLFHQMEAERARLKLQDPKKNAAKIKDLEDRLNDRAKDLAKDVKEKDLNNVPAKARDLPIRLLRPHNDPVFAELATQARDTAHAKSRSVDETNPAQNSMKDRLDELARDYLAKDRPQYLEPYVEGIPYEQLPLDEDPAFHDMEVQRAVLKDQDPKKNADKIKDLEGHLNDRAHELAKAALAADRGYLDPEPEGVPLKDLPLDSDPTFHKLETERAKLKAVDPVKNDSKIKALENQLNDRAHELAKDQLKKDLEGLDQNPRGIPIEDLAPHTDPTFASHLPELRQLKTDPKKNAAKIGNHQDEMNNRLNELAKEKIDKERAFLDPNPEGIPLSMLPLDDDKEFKDLERQLRQARKDPKRNADRIKDLEDKMNDRVHQLAQEKIKGDRGYLDAEPEGVPLRNVPIDDDPTFRDLEAQRAKLKENPEKNKAAIAEKEKQLNDRAHELAKKKKDADRDFLNPVSNGIPKELLPLDEDPNFQRMEQQLRRLQEDPRRNAAAIDNLKDMMQDRADELGDKMVRGDRDQYLDPTPEGIPIEDLPLDTDPRFAEMEKERAILKAEDPVGNADKIKDLEGKLNDRAHELAKEMRANDRAFLDPEPEGIPIEDVPLDNDQNFLRMEDYLRKLKKNPRRNADAIEDTEDKMNDRAHELAKGVVADDLKCLPHDKYRGIPKEDLNLHSYPKFRDAANRRRKALRNPKRAPTEVAIIEDEMDGIAREIADDVIDNERAFLVKEPEGMDIKDLPLDNDPTFAALEDERRRRTNNPAAAKRNKEVVRDLEDRMNDRAHELAKEAFAKARKDFMDPEPEGVPLSKLPLDTDPLFKEAEIARYKELKKPNPDQKKVKDLERQMNDRAHALAKEMLDKDRAFLDPEPEGVPLDMLPLATDPEFNELAQQRQALKNAGKRNNDPAVKDIEDKMNDRAHQLAKQYLDQNRDYLDPAPQNVPLKDLPLNRDPVFREMENELMQLKKDPKKNAEQIAQLKKDLNDRADEIAKDLLNKERAGQDQEPLGVALRDLPLNFDPTLNALERKRRDLKKDPKKNADALRGVEADIEARVRAIAQDYLDKERDFMDPEPEGVPLNELNLSDDPKFHDMEKQLRELKKQPAKNKDAIADLQEQMNDRAHELAKEKLAKDRGYLDPEPLGVPIDLLPLNDDKKFTELEKKRQDLKKDPRTNSKAIKDLEDQLNDRAKELAQEYKNKERAFLDPKPEGIAVKDLPLDNDKTFREMERQLRELKKEPTKNKDAIADLQDQMNDRAHELAKRQLADDRAYLKPEARGVPVSELDLDNDPTFRDLELQRKEAKKDPKNAGKVRDLELQLNNHADTLAADFLKKDRAYLDPEPEGVPLEELPLDEDADFKGMEQDRRRLNKGENKNNAAVKDLENKLNDRAHVLAKEKKGYQDLDFHAANEDIAEMWPRLRELYPEGVYDPLTPDTTLPSDVSSAPQDMGFLAPFIAALSRHTVLISRLFQDKAHPYMQPYRITLFNPDCSPATVEVDDRVPCDENKEPKFTQVPSRMWYPLLLEKAYAKFVGGYENFNNCNAHDTLRDLTGRPVVHISLEDPKHAAAQNMGDFTTPAFWRRISNDFARGDIFVCVANGEVPNGIHPQCCYALMDVIETRSGSEDPQDVVIKVHNCYRDAPLYNGRLRKGDSNWTADIRRACSYNEEEDDVIYMPLPTFLDNFSCMQRCKINCGDRLSSPGEWNEYTAGGTSKFTTFRSNPIYIVQNKTSRPATILAEVRHAAPLYVDETNCKRYPYTGLTLMQPIDSKLPPTPFITNGTHKFLQKGMMLDSREVCSEMEIPASSTCYLIPYTKDRGTQGKFDVSIYPDMANVTLTPLRHAGLTLKPLKTDVKLTAGEEGTRLDFMVADATDVHILLHQNQVSDANSVRRGDAVGEDEIALAAFNEYGIKVGSTGDPTSAREHALVFKAPQGGRYSVLATCSTSGPCPASIEIYTAANVEADLVPVAPDAKPLSLQSGSRFPTLNRTATAPSRERGASRGSARRVDSLPAATNGRAPSGRRVTDGRSGSRGRR